MLNKTRNQIIIENKSEQIMNLILKENQKFLKLNLSVFSNNSSLLADDRLKQNIKDNNLIIEVDKVKFIGEKETKLEVSFKKGEAIQSLIVNPNSILLKHDVEILENNNLDLNITLPNNFFEFVNDKKIQVSPEIKVITLKYIEDEDIRFFRQDKNIYFVDNIIDKDNSFKMVSGIVTEKGKKDDLKFIFDNNKALDLSNIEKHELKIMKEFVKGSNLSLDKIKEENRIIENRPKPTVITPIQQTNSSNIQYEAIESTPESIINDKNANFSIPVFIRQDNKQIKIGEKVTTYGLKENVFSYGTDLTSNGQPLMNVSINRLEDGTYSKVLAVNNVDHKFDIFNSVGIIQGNEILIELEDFEYNTTTEITASFKKVLEIDGVKYKSIDVLAKNIALVTNRGMKSIYKTENNKMINQVVPSNFFELFSQSIIKGEKLPSQQVEALFKLDKDKIPKGIISINSYLLGKKKVNTLTLEYNGPMGEKKQWLYMQAGAEAYEIDKIYKIPNSSNGNPALLFGTFLGREKDDAVGENSRVYKIENIDENAEDFKRFQRDIINNTSTKNNVGLLDVTYEESQEKQITDPLEIRKGSRKIITKEDEGGQLPPPPPGPVDPGPIDPGPVEPGPKKKKRNWLKKIGFAILMLATAGCLAFGIVAAAFTGMSAVISGSFIAMGVLGVDKVRTYVLKENAKIIEERMKASNEGLAKKAKKTQEKINELENTNQRLREPKQENINELENTNQNLRESEQENINERDQENTNTSDESSNREQDDNKNNDFSNSFPSPEDKDIPLSIEPPVSPLPLPEPPATPALTDPNEGIFSRRLEMPKKPKNENELYESLKEDIEIKKPPENKEKDKDNGRDF